MYIYPFIHFFSICTSQVHQGELFQKRLIVVLQKLITVVHKKSNNTYEIVTKFSEKNLLIISSINNKGL